jgi:DNA-binding beta-propeller fold protein YncE
MLRTHPYGDSRRTGRLVTCLFACAALALPATLAASTHDDSAVRLLDAVEVGSTLTGEFGFARPTGLAYVPGKRLLLVAAPGPARTRLLRIGAFEESLGAFSLPKISNASTLAFDPFRSQLTAIDGKKRIAVDAADLEAKQPTSERADVRNLQLKNVQGASFDPKSGTWLLLDSGAREIVRVPAKDGVYRTPTRVSLTGLGDGRLRGLARNPADGLLYVASPEQRLLYAVDRSGNVAKTFDIGSARIRNLRALVFAPSADRTDRPRVQSLYIADAGGGRREGRIVELSLAPRSRLALTFEGTLTKTIYTSRLHTPAPDPAGITYLADSDTLLVSDSEVEEMPIYRGANLYFIKRSGHLVGNGTTVGYSHEPTGVSFDTHAGVLYVPDDDKDRVYSVGPGADGRLGTPDDTVASFSTTPYGSYDPEDIVFQLDSGHLFICDGSGKEVYDIDPVNGVFGDGNDVAAHFDVGKYGIRNCEGIGSDPQRRTLLVIDDYERKIFELSRSGRLLRTITIPLSDPDLWLAGVTVAPTSNPNDGPSAMSYWIVDRHVDNNANPKENDGRIYEVLRP